MKRYTTIPNATTGPSGDPALPGASATRLHEEPLPPGAQTPSPVLENQVNSVDGAQKAKGAAQMAAGAVVAAAGVPMLVLPGPGAAAIAGGVALASKGQRAYSGREATAVEEKLDAAAEKMVSVAKEQGEAAARKVASEAPVVAEKAVTKAGDWAGAIISTGVDALGRVVKGRKA